MKHIQGKIFLNPFIAPFSISIEISDGTNHKSMADKKLPIDISYTSLKNIL